MVSGAHGVLTKNKNSSKIFISLFYNHLPQKIPCGRGTIFERFAHVRAKGRGRANVLPPVLVVVFLNQQPETMKARPRIGTVSAVL